MNASHFLFFLCQDKEHHTHMFLIIVGHTTGLRQRRQANGCGAEGSVNIDRSLKYVGEHVMIPCCNRHDICYETCGKTQNECDSEFRSCMNAACNTIKAGEGEWWMAMRRFLCLADALAIHRIVIAFGTSPYNATQQSHGCEHFA
ncbi:unnamed protein product [Rotaria socialis]